MKKNIYILPFDHRSSFIKDILKIKGEPTASDLKLIKDLKKIIFEGFLLASQDFNKKDLAILVDEKFGSDIIKQAHQKNITLCIPVEKSGQSFAFEYGKNFGKHIIKQNPDYVKALLRYDPIPQNTALNKFQLKNLNELASFCKKYKYKLLIELLVPLSRKELTGSTIEQDKKRAQKTVLAIQEIQTIVSPAIWKLEGMRRKDWPMIIKTIKPNSKIVVLGRGESKEQVKQWLSDAAPYPSIIGFAIGRTIFKEALEIYLKKDISRQEAALWIAVEFSFFINFWQKKRKNN
ncbi:MAG TPA: DUF2090 domain-containing protein [Candidatus Paceibacterota bacterium]|jgi:myo-inositol catabolism protein IolC|nr:DUF2090 domain-containing protein [Candidatus Pacearchaeota archaeon]HRR94748.1 DUF2090 domain-containing protein [Candidatus Paceibacterota bacterium]HRU20867.1 DUF2090 domain-containing protein [Candidatus Paceibacterota bacterium]